MADVGPRIIFYGFCNGENELHEVDGMQGRAEVLSSAFTEDIACGSPRRWREHIIPTILPVRFLSRRGHSFHGAPEVASGHASAEGT